MSANPSMSRHYSSGYRYENMRVQTRLPHHPTSSWYSAPYGRTYEHPFQQKKPRRRNILLDMQDDMFADALSWLSAEDVGRLDVAIGEKEFRSAFLRIIKGFSKVPWKLGGQISNGYLKWLYLRNFHPTLIGANNESNYSSGSGRARSPHHSAEATTHTGMAKHIDTRIYPVVSKDCEDLYVFSMIGIDPVSIITITTTAELCVQRLNLVTDHGIDYILSALAERCQHLDELRIKCKDCEYSTAIYTLLRKCVGLKQLHLVGFRLDRELLMDICMYCPALESVKLDDCFIDYTSTSAYRDAYSDNMSPLDMPSVTQIAVTGLRCVNDTLLCQFIRGCINLEQLGLSYEGPYCVTDETLLYTRATQLKHLHVSSAEVTDAGICGLLERNSGICHVGISDVDHFTDTGMQRLTRLCPDIENLALRNCNALTNVCINHVSSHLTKLKYFSATKCANLSQVAVAAIQRSLERYRVVPRIY